MQLYSEAQDKSQVKVSLVDVKSRDVSQPDLQNIPMAG